MTSYCIGLTGGIGSGKSTVADLFRQHGVPIIDADKIAHALLEPNTQAYFEVIRHFSEKILDIHQAINRHTLRTIIFNNTSEKKWLESYLHPLIRQEIQKEIHAANTPYAIVDIPLLIKKENYPYLNRILVVDCPEDLQLKRVMSRDNQDILTTKKIIDAQISRETRNALADDTILNNGDLDSLKLKVATLHQKYLQLSIRI